MECKHKYTVENILFEEDKIKIRCINCGELKFVPTKKLGEYPLYPPMH